jgi:GT2 family glycosyltransferase
VISSSNPIVSVIVPCYNSERTIRRCLTAILAQRTDVPYDVVVVDSSLDQTPQIVAREFPSVQLIHLDRRTFAGAARNIGARSTPAPFCLMIDSDCVAQPDLIERMIARHREAEYAAVGGSLSNGTPGSLSGLTGYLLEFKEFIPAAPMRLEKTVPTANVAYRRETLERQGFFDEEMWLAEDVLFNWRIYKSGGRILFDPAITVIHLNRTGWREVLSYQVSLGKWSAEARRRGGLPGSELLRRPALIALMPLVRVARAAVWLARTDAKTFLAFLLVSPMYLLAACYWSFGFYQGATRAPIEGPAQVR